MTVDGSYRDDGYGGAGLIVKNEHRSVVGVWSKKLENMSSPLHAEAETARLGLLTALQQGWTNLKVECDCTVLLAALNQQSNGMVKDVLCEDKCNALSITRDRGIMSLSMSQIPINNNNGFVAVPLI
ncbi:hypothetical protein ACLB2K_001590 [Fragaria x ananassa]